jgi:TRAP-type C4-dicarboxylate transport system permease small subunit
VLSTLDRIIDRVLSWVVSVFLLVTVIVTALQIFFRYVLNRPFFWAEEVAQLLFLWLIYLGSILALRFDKHLVVDLLYVALPPNLRRIVDLVIKSLMGLFLVILTKEGFGLVISEMASVTAALELPEGVVYLIVPISGILMLFYLFFAPKLLTKYKGGTEKETESLAK